MPIPPPHLIPLGLPLAAGPSARDAETVVFKGHTDPVYAVAVSPTGRLVATGSFDKTIKLWDPATGKEVRTLGGSNGHTNQVLSLAFSPFGLRLASGGSDNQARVWPVSGDAPPKVLGHPNLVDAVEFDKTGSLLATACHDGILRLWDVAKGQPAKTINAHTQPAPPSPIYCLAWSPDGKRIATGSYDRSIKVWDPASGNIVREIRPGRDKAPVEPTVGRSAPAVIGFAGGWLNAPPDRGHRDQVFAVAYSPNGKFLASGSSDRTVKLWDPATGELVHEFPNPALKPAGPGQPPASHPGFVHSVRFTPDGTKLVSVGTAPRGQGYLAVWSVADGRLLSGQELPFGPIYSVAVTPDGSAVLLGCGARARQTAESDAVLMPLPGK